MEYTYWYYIRVKLSHYNVCRNSPILKFGKVKYLWGWGVGGSKSHILLPHSHCSYSFHFCLFVSFWSLWRRRGRLSKRWFSHEHKYFRHCIETAWITRWWNSNSGVTFNFPLSTIQTCRQGNNNLCFVVGESLRLVLRCSRERKLGILSTRHTRSAVYNNLTLWRLTTYI